MSWKTWPIWLKIGIFAILIELLSLLIGLFLVGLSFYFDCPRSEGVCNAGIISIIGWVLVFPTTWPFRALEISMVLEFLIFILQFFIIGALIGLIYNKLKTKKKRKNER